MSWPPPNTQTAVELETQEVVVYEVLGQLGHYEQQALIEYSSGRRYCLPVLVSTHFFGMFAGKMDLDRRSWFDQLPTSACLSEDAATGEVVVVRGASIWKPFDRYSQIVRFSGETLALPTNEVAHRYKMLPNQEIQVRGWFGVHDRPTKDQLASLSDL